MSHRDKKKQDDADLKSTQQKGERRPSPSPHSWSRSRSPGSLATLSLHRPSDASLNPATSETADLPPSFDYDHDALGLRVIHDPVTAPVADIIFVHGLGGHCYKTWSREHNADYFWPGLWLPKDLKIGQARLLTFGYDSSLTGPKSVLNILGFARSLLFEMRHSRGDSIESLRIGDAPIIFVAHSMGGLVVKKAILMAQNDNNYRDLAQAMSGIVFLSTPHRGSDLANTLNLMLRLFFQPERSFIKELGPGSSAIEDINEQFRHVAQNLSIISFHESQSTYIGGKPFAIVTRDSAILGYANEEPCELKADHHTICKFEDDQDPNFRIVRDTLKDLVEKFGKRLRGVSGGATPSTNEDIRKLLMISRTPVEDYNTLRKRWVPGSCDWMMRNTAIQFWLTDLSDSHMVWYNAPPASGKSVMSSYIINYLQSSGRNCLFYFFNYGDQMRRSISAMLKSFAYQLSSVLPEYGQALLANLSEDLRLDKSDYRLLWQRLFESHLFPRTFKRPLFWVIDGLDESESPETIIGLLEEMLCASQMTFKVLITSRRSEPLVLRFKKLQRLLKVDVLDGELESQNTEDIKLLIDRELPLLYGSAELKDKLRQEILDRARGNFLWVSLVLEELHSCQTEREIRSTLDQIPEGMAKMYERMESAVTQSSAEKRVELAKELLQWAVCAHRPLTLTELKEAISKDYSDIINLRRTIRDVCGQFILIDSTDHITIVHQTARDFLTKTSKSAIAVDRRDAHDNLLVKSISSLFKTGVRVLGQDSTKGVQLRQQLKASHPFWLYAASSWFFHLGKASPISDEVLNALERFFGGAPVLDWIYMLAHFDQIRTLAKAGKALTSFVAANRKLNSSRNPMLHRLSSIELLETWSVDLVRITAKFNKHLVTQPDAIYETIPAVCPPISVINREYHRALASRLKLSGQNTSWNDVFARFSLSQDEVALKVASCGPHVAVLSHGGTVYIWSAAEFGEICVLRHGEPVTNMCMNDKGDILATDGSATTTIWDIPAGTIRLKIPNVGNSRALSIIFASNDQRVIAAMDDKSVRHLQITQEEPLWEDLHPSLLQENNQPQSAILNSPYRMEINAAGTQIGVCYRSFPLTVWDLNRGTIIRRCMRSVSNLNMRSPSSQPWFPVELFAWNQVTGHIIGCYKGNTLFKWHPVSDENYEVSAFVDNLVSSPNGKVFVTSDTNGTVKVWNFTYFAVIYQLSSGDLVSGLSFNPDSTRFYDIRSSSITAWEPNALLRLAEADETFSDDASDVQPSTTISHASEANVPDYVALSSLAPSPNGLYYATGNDDGEVYLGSTLSSVNTELTRFNNFQPVSHLAWSPNSEIVVAADLATDVRIIEIGKPRPGHVKNGKFKILPNPTFDLQGRAIHQIVLDHTAQYLLVVSTGLAQTWDIIHSKINSSSNIDHTEQFGWLAHPTDQEMLLAVGDEVIKVYRWSSLQEVHAFTFKNEVPLIREPSRAFGSVDLSTDSMTKDAIDLRQKSVTNVHSVILAQDGKHILIHVKYRLPGGKVQKRIFVVEAKALETRADRTASEEVECSQIPAALSLEIEYCLGILRDQRLVFLDRDLWICTTPYARQGDGKSVTRHYFIPRDWTDVEGLRRCSMLKDGTLLCPQEGNVVVAQSNLGRMNDV